MILRKYLPFFLPALWVQNSIFAQTRQKAELPYRKTEGIQWEGGSEVAHWLNQKGIAAFLLRYRLAPTAEDGVKEIWMAKKLMAGPHLHAKGRHGFGMKKQGLPSDSSIDRTKEWAVAQGIKTGSSQTAG